MASRPPDDDARNRWMVIQVMRTVGFGLVILGILMTQGAVDIAGDYNAWAGYGLIAVGLVDGFLMPQVLARKWRSPRQ
jgi:hypothetical protein